jgi:catechol 2,3-dioxygenase-like lactoylglutathione lyase family enzyme
MTNQIPSAILNHVGFNVTDADRAARWYADVLGFEIVIPAFEIAAGEGEPGQRFARLAGPSFGRCRIAYLTSPSGVMVEIFEFIDPPTPPVADAWSYWRPGLWHVGLTVPDLEAAVARIEAAGGEQQSDYFEVPAGSGYRLVFCLDPWGNALELMNVNCERMITRALPRPGP